MATLAALGIALVAQQAVGQDYYGAPAGSGFQPQVMAGFSATSGEVGNYLQSGWIVDGGFIYWLPQGRGLGLRADLSYSDHEATNQFLSFGQRATGQEVDDGWGSFSSAATGLVYQLPLGARASLYGLAQIGISHVHLRLVQTFFTPGYYCDPFFDYCDYPDVGAASVYSYNANRLSWNVGIGVNFAGYGTHSWFIEAQYRRIETSPRPFEYWPIMVGIRF
ncbi:MAG: outer membrane beta-barrel protein [Steroidobacteraceae bacterium]